MNESKRLDFLGGVASRLEPVQKVELTSTWIRGDRQVFDHHGKNIAVSIVVCVLVLSFHMLYIVVIYIHRIKLLICFV